MTASRTAGLSILDALDDPQLFGHLADFGAPSWARWRAFLAALFALPMSEAAHEIYAQHTARATLPTVPPSEVYIAAGRRSGKTFMASVIAVFLACFRDYRPHLSPGERAMILCVANDREQAAILLRYMRAFLEGVPMLAAMIERQTSDSIELTNRVTLSVATCSYRAVRGVTLAAAILDEIAFWRVDGANPDREVLTALRPATVTIPGALLLAISTPYARSGMLYEALRDHHGREGSDVLTWKATSLEMNATLPASVIDRARLQDAAAAASEWDAEFRSDLSTFLDAELIAACVESGIRERPPVAALTYVAAVDPSGGDADAFTLAIGHAESGTDPAPVVLDLCRGWRTPNVETVVAEIADHCRRYHLGTVTGDRYSAEWVVSAFRRHGIHYRHATQNRSEVYLEMHPLIATGRSVLLDHPTLIAELRQLERRTSRHGRDTIDHPVRGHDDHANAAGLALVLATDRARRRSVEEYRHMFAEAPGPSHPPASGGAAPGA